MHHAPAGTSDRLLDPAGVAVLRRSAARRSPWWGLVGVLTALLTMLPLGLFAFVGGGHSQNGNGLEHLLGRTEQVTAQVDAVQVDGHCRWESRNRFHLELSWTTGPPPGHSAYLMCKQAPAVGELLQAWVDSQGAVFLESPTQVRVGMGALGLGLGIATVGTGAAMLVPLARRRRRLLAAANTPLLPPVPVLAAPNNGRKLGFPFRPAPHVAGVAPPMWALSILSATPGRPLKLTSRRKLTGEWHFRAGPVLKSGRQLGVLERGQERCWVEARPMKGKVRR